MKNCITDLDRITAAIDPTGAIETYLWDELTNGAYWDSIGQMINQLESASCAAGSWSRMIYTRDILDCLADPQWQADIDDAIADWRDNTGESPDFPDLSSMVTFAVDHVAYQLASKLRSLDHVAVVTAAADSCDPCPDVIAFDTVWEAEDWVAEEIERRVQHAVDHSPHPVSEDDRDSMVETETELFTITDERL